MVRKPTEEIPLKAQVIARVSVAIIRLFSLTLRSRLIDHCEFQANPPKESLIWATWHNALFSFPMIYRRYFFARKGAAMASASKDGAVVAQVLRLLQVEPIRGSSSRRGGQALREMSTWLKDGYDVALTPDGPRGPCYHLSPGVVFLASMSGCRILPVRVEYQNCWKLKSWDQFRIPKPFSRVDIHVGPYAEVPSGVNAENLEPHRIRIETLLRGEVRKSGPESGDVLPANAEASP